MLYLSDERLHSYEGDNNNRQIDKYSKEYYVLAVLKHYNVDEAAKLYHSDSPDLKSTNSMLGIEVTEAVSFKEKQMSSAFRKMRNPKSDKHAKKFYSEITQLGGKVFLDGKGLSLPAYTDQSIIRQMENAVLSKCDKLEEYRNSSKVVGLALCFDTESDWDCDQFYPALLNIRDTMADSFDIYYLLFWHRILIISFIDNSKQIIAMNSEETIPCKILARKTAEGIISEQDTVWQCI